MGKPYVWGGGNFEGPIGGGFDCSGLVLYAAYQASGGRIRLPHCAGDHVRYGMISEFSGQVMTIRRRT
ncbi:NlpC/P60 family protein [Nocardioides endophyticus]|uniref:NlpC/P60 family protein n=1 Tax=Nocardioides endophyticus TaxID=1353775 RepID=UPI003CD0854D